jgi:hypothetical protein
MELGQAIFGNPLPEECNIEIDRMLWQPLFYKLFLDRVGLNDYSSYENEVFVLRCYSWDEEDDRPNFEHKLSGYKIAWYKYPMRSAYHNKDIDVHEYILMLNHCANSICSVKVMPEWGLEDEIF